MEKTERLFDSDAYIKDFTAKVVSSEERDGSYLTVLDRTAFFPEEGGQSADTGKIEDSDVTYVFEKDGVIYHRTGKRFTPGETVRCALDFEARYRKMKSHTGEHILCGVAHRLWGAENVGFHLSEEYVRVDLDVYLDHDKVALLEREANRAVGENHKVVAWYPDAEELATTDFRSKSGIEGDVRLVQIEGVDICACCAPHVKTTCEVGMLKVVDSIKYKGGTRLEIVCGPDAVDLFIKEHAALTDIAVSFSVKREDVPGTVSRRCEEISSLTYKLKRVERERDALRLESLEPTDGDLIFFFDGDDAEAAREFLNGAAAKCRVAAGFLGADGNYRYIIRSDRVDLKSACKDINAAIGGRGGGTAQMIQGSCQTSRDAIEKYFA